MNVKEAVDYAKRHILELFSEENLTNVGLEEVEYEDQSGDWIVTIGFSRPWDEPRNTLAALAAGSVPRRAYKVVRISDTSRKVVSVKNRETEN
jgi:hypothetical protein